MLRKLRQLLKYIKFVIIFKDTVTTDKQNYKIYAR